MSEGVKGIIPYPIVGMQHHDGAQDIVSAMSSGELLILKRDPTNEHDKRAIQVWGRGHLLGYIRASMNKDLSEYMDAKCPDGLGATFAVTADRWPHAQIDVEE